MPKNEKRTVKWLDDASEEDYQAASHYLALLDNTKNITKVLTDFKGTGIVEYKATDLLRAAQLSLPKQDDRPTREHMKKIRNGEAISPVLLLRDVSLKKVIIADGFHRISAAFRIDPDVALHCKLV